MNHVLETIVTRRSIRAYKEQQIGKDDLITILTAGSYAPSGMGMQSWKFTAIQDPDVMEQVNETMQRALLSIPSDTDSYGYFTNYIRKAQDNTASFLYHAPTYILVSNLNENYNSMADSAVAIENMMLVAHSLGIGSCWLNQVPRLSDVPIMRDFLTKLGIPKDHKVYGSVAMGYPATNTRAAAPRKDVFTII